MKRRSKLLIAGITMALAAIGGTGVALATGVGDDSEPAITGGAYDRAAAAALDHTGGGNVTDTEVGDEESYYEVEVTRVDGSQVDVQLDKGFNVVTSDADVETGGDTD